MPHRVPIAVGILSDTAGRVLIARRPAHARHGGLWEFPGGKQAARESAVAALRRELREELGIGVQQAAPWLSVEHDYPQGGVRLQVWHVARWSGTPAGNEGQEVRWIAPDELRGFDFPEADRPILNRLSLPVLYAVTPDCPEYDADFFARLESALVAGLKLLQFRNHRLAPDARRAAIDRLRDACHRRGCLLLLNGTPQEALAAGADGVHLTAAALRALRGRPPAQLLVGASCHNAGELGIANRLRADFAVLGPLRQTPGHAQGPPLGWKDFAVLAAGAGLPCYALGGVTAGDAQAARRNLAHGVAMIRGLWDAADPAAVVHECAASAQWRVGEGSAPPSPGAGSSATR
jgi:8-oxo-dGTP diphosphatase